MNKQTIHFIVTAAQVEGKFYEPDYPIEFDSDEWPEVSLHDIAQKTGGKLWRNMHGETPERVMYETVVLK